METLILDLSRIEEIPRDLFCNLLGKNIRRLSIIHYISEVSDLALFNCTSHLKHLSIVNTHISLRRHTSTTWKSGATDLPNTIESLQISDVFASTSDYEHTFLICSRINQNPCDLGIEDFFPEKKYKEIIPFSNISLGKGTEAYSEFTRIFPGATNLKQLVLRDNRGQCSRPNEGAAKHMLLLHNQLQVLDMRSSTLLSCFGWFEDETLALVGLPHLEYIDLSLIGLKSLPRITGLRRLRTVKASSNLLGYYHKGGSNGWSLEREFFWGQPLLQWLDLSDNTLVSVPHNIVAAHPEMKHLQLGGNRLESANLHIDFPLKNKVELVNISNNGLSYLRPSFINELEKHGWKSMVVDLSNNPFLCVCELKPMVEWLQSTSINVYENTPTHVTMVKESTLPQ